MRGPEEGESWRAKREEITWLYCNEKKLRSQNMQSFLCLLTDNQSNIHSSEHTNITLPAHSLAKHCGSLHHQWRIWATGLCLPYPTSISVVIKSFIRPKPSFPFLGLQTSHQVHFSNYPHPSPQHLGAGHDELLPLAFSDITPPSAPINIYSATLTPVTSPAWMGGTGGQWFPLCMLSRDKPPTSVLG